MLIYHTKCDFGSVPDCAIYQHCASCAREPSAAASLRQLRRDDRPATWRQCSGNIAGEHPGVAVEKCRKLLACRPCNVVWLVPVVISD